MQKYFEELKPRLIYVFRVPNERHEGCLKVGETTLDADGLSLMDVLQLQPNASLLNNAARARINQYTQTVSTPYDLLYTELAIYTKGLGVASFQDKDVHAVLLRSGVKRKEFEGTAKQGKEWFVTDLETVKRAIKAVKEGRQSLLPHEVTLEQSPIEFRPEQRKAIDDTKKRFARYDRMLWNAKMRFGKTLSALQVVKEMDYRRTLILTHRPVVDDGWFGDFQKIFYDSPNYDYGSKKKGASHASLEKRAQEDGLHYVYFASIQDLRGSEAVGGKFDKNDNIFSTPWDLLIVDEAHEGTQTALGKAVMEELSKHKPKELSLTGTAFNLINNYDEDGVYTWDYTMEQRAKAEWDQNHFGDPNPYAGLPRMNIYTYDLGRLLKSDEFDDEDVAFNFREFFRTTPEGRFVHEADVRHFLDLLTKEDPESMYPFANQRYRSIFRHTLWMLPGVKEAKAMSALLRQHPTFGYFEIVNVAGEGDEEEAHEEALQKVNKAIKDHPDGTITLSCGRLTTGVSVPQWMGVLMLAGSFNTAASSYMQTIFRVQTPYTFNGLVKEDCYVFDFAPDRTLQVLATVPRVSTKAGKTTEEQKQALAQFLNFCPVIGMEGSKMVAYDANRMMEQLKKAYVERVVTNGFEDGYLYNDELLKLSDVDVKDFADLKAKIGQTKAIGKTGNIDINRQGLTNEEYEEKERLEKKPKKQLTPEEQARLEELRKKKKVQQDAISILRGISIRMPLLIYGAEITDEDEQLTIDNFTSLIDPQSWEEFMPKGVTKQVFNRFKKYYDADIFAAAGKRIRAMARAADRLTIEERIERLAHIFNSFRNPDKETILTPWRVVNMHMGDCLGGYCFFDEEYKELLREPRYIDHHRVTDDVFTPGSYLLEINSKSGLYPLYLAYNLYRRALKEEMTSPKTLEEHQRVWDLVVRDNIFVICKTPMAKSITRRTLMGYRPGKVNTRYFEDLVNQIKNKPDNFLAKMVKGHSFWKRNDNDNMKFKAIVGNPPYQEMDGGAGVSATPLYNLFVDISKKFSPNYISMIMPAKWYTDGKGLENFRLSMFQDTHLEKLVDFTDSRDVFPTVDVAGGVCYFLRNADYDGECKFISCHQNERKVGLRNLAETKTFVRHLEGSSIVDKIKSLSTETLDSRVSTRKPFGLATNVLPMENGDIRLRFNKGFGLYDSSLIEKNKEAIPCWKVIISYLAAEHAGQTDAQGKKKILSSLSIL
ncbi:MAG: Eco57I restriction-modification methylase domain-containing protein, partial [Bacteroidales bacterium]|nr:Eco57I restriction-modification methylase domain-containing protein [Bacteroidales bacterium]